MALRQKHRASFVLHKSYMLIPVNKNFAPQNKGSMLRTTKLLATILANPQGISRNFLVATYLDIAPDGSLDQIIRWVSINDLHRFFRSTIRTAFFAHNLFSMFDPTIPNPLFPSRNF